MNRDTDYLFIEFAEAVEQELPGHTLQFWARTEKLEGTVQRVPPENRVIWHAGKGRLPSFANIQAFGVRVILPPEKKQTGIQWVTPDVIDSFGGKKVSAEITPALKAAIDQIINPKS